MIDWALVLQQCATHGWGAFPQTDFLSEREIRDYERDGKEGSAEERA
jgi:hypothetical protein